MNYDHGSTCSPLTPFNRLQLAFPGLIVLFSWMIPESPRWDFVSNKRSRAIATLTKYHGYGNPESAWVQLQLQEYEEYLNEDGAVRMPFCTLQMLRQRPPY